MAVEFYRLTRALTLPRHLKDQLNRAASSVVLNLAEGSGRSSLDDQKRFFVIAMGSIRESQAILALADGVTLELADSIDKLAAHAYRLIKNTRGG